jgi:hypothetical protein
LSFARRGGSSCELLALHNYLVVIQLWGSNLSRKCKFFCGKQVYFTQNFSPMTTDAIKVQIQEQIDALRKVTDKATESKEAATKYLENAGISTEEKSGKTDKKDKK